MDVLEDYLDEHRKGFDPALPLDERRLHLTRAISIAKQIGLKSVVPAVEGGMALFDLDAEELWHIERVISAREIRGAA